MEINKMWYLYGAQVAHACLDQPMDLSQRPLKRKAMEKIEKEEEEEEDERLKYFCNTVPYKKRMVSRYYQGANALFSEN